MTKIYTTWLTGLVRNPEDENDIQGVDIMFGEFTDPEAAERQIRFFLTPGNFPYIIKGTPCKPGLRFQIDAEEEDDYNDYKVLKTFYLEDYGL